MEQWKIKMLEDAKYLQYDEKCFEDIKAAETENEGTRALINARHRKWD